jgi:hypothetical protein
MLAGFGLPLDEGGPTLAGSNRHPAMLSCSPYPPSAAKNEDDQFY